MQRQRLQKLERQDFELRLFNADTGYEYTDETKFVPTNASAVAFQEFEEGKATGAKNISLIRKGTPDSSLNGTQFRRARREF